MHNLLALIGNSFIYFNIQSLVHLALAYIISFAIIYPTYPISIYFVAFLKLSKPQLYWYMYCKVDYNMTIVSPLLGLSWLNRIPLQAYMP